MFSGRLGCLLSATISVIFALLGASVVASVMKAGGERIVPVNFFEYLHNDKILAIMAGFLLSIAFAFITGFLIQWLIRIIFTFQYREKIRYYGAIYGATVFLLLVNIALSAIKNSNILNQSLEKDILENRNTILLVCFLAFLIISQLFLLIRRFKILNLTILTGTFAVAFAFAGNDLANFLGIPLAAFDSFKSWLEAGKPDPDTLKMDFLNQPIGNEISLLLLFGASIFLGILHFRKMHTYHFIREDSQRNSEGGEKPNLYPVSRSIVRGSIITARRIGRRIHPRVKKMV